MIDTHAHLYMCDDSIENLIARAKTAGLSRIVHVGIDVDSSLKALDSAKQYSEITPTIGIHPCESNKAHKIDQIETLATEHPFKAIGEIGLDYFKMYAEKEIQKSVFIQQLEIAQRVNLPVIIHNRHADDDILEILKNFPDIKKVLHCFSSSYSFAEQLLDLNCYFSFTATITYAKKGKTINAVRELPLDKVMIETDCPYLSPQIYKGQANEPAFVVEVAKRIAEIKGISVDTVINQTSATAESFFNLRST